MSSIIQLEFWRKIPQSPRRVFPHPIKTSVRISRAIFDTRGISDRNKDSIRSFVELACPSHAIVDNSIVLNGLQPANSALLCLTPEYVRDLLKNSSIDSTLNRLPEEDIKSILRFILESWSVEDLDGCYVLRLADGSFAKIVRITENENIFYIADKDGFDLFKQIRK